MYTCSPRLVIRGQNELTDFAKYGAHIKTFCLIQLLPVTSFTDGEQGR